MRKLVGGMGAAPSSLRRWRQPWARDRIRHTTSLSIAKIDLSAIWGWCGSKMGVLWGSGSSLNWLFFLLGDIRATVSSSELSLPLPCLAILSLRQFSMLGCRSLTGPWRDDLVAAPSLCRSWDQASVGSPVPRRRPSTRHSDSRVAQIHIGVGTPNPTP